MKATVMSDEKKEDVHTDHFCQAPDCERWGSFGFQAVANEPARWYCMEHRQHGEQMLARRRLQD